MAIALFVSLVAFGNITNYSTNFAFVYHLFEMDMILPDATIKYRNIQSPFIQHLGYILIISAETLTAMLCWLGAFVLFKNLKASGIQIQ